jgi:hypothetical protein
MVHGVTSNRTPRATKVAAEAAGLHLWLVDGEWLIPWSNCSPILAEASPEGRSNLWLSPTGCGIHWPDLEEHLSVTRLTINAV